MTLPPFDPQVIGFSCLGAILPDVLRIIKDRYGVAPTYLKSWYFWLGVLLSILIGGFTGWLAQPKDVVSTLAIGFSAPAILTKLLGSQPPSPGARLSRITMRQWWAT